MAGIMIALNIRLRFSKKQQKKSSVGVLKLKYSKTITFTEGLQGALEESNLLQSILILVADPTSVNSFYLKNKSQQACFLTGAIV